MSKFTDQTDNPITLPTDVDPTTAQAAELMQQTALIPWSELQRYYARGLVRHVSSDLDLIMVGITLSNNDIAQTEAWHEAGQLDLVSDEQALKWVDNDSQVWAMVIAPWVLVQDQVEK